MAQEHEWKEVKGARFHSGWHEPERRREQRAGIYCWVGQTRFDAHSKMARKQRPKWCPNLMDVAFRSVV